MNFDRADFYSEEVIFIKRKFLSAILRLAVIATLLMIPVSFRMGLQMVVPIQILVILALFWGDYYIRNKVTSFTIASILSIGIGFISITIITYLGEHDTFFWFLLFPATTMFSMGLKNGLRWNIFTLVILSALLARNLFLETMSISSVSIIFVCYIVMVIISYFIENARQSIENRLYETSLTDFLTNTKNRRAFDRTLKSLINNSTRYHHTFSLLSIDLDHFKFINDTYGHPVGDLVLIEFTHLISKNLRSTDEIFRIGGEEFALVLPETNLKGAEEFAIRLQDQIRSYTFDSKIRLTASMGIVQFEIGMDYKAILKQADKMLYRAKEKGRDRIEMEIIKTNI